MSLWGFLFGGGKPPQTQPAPGLVHIWRPTPRRAFNFNIVGEASYQRDLARLAGGKTEDGVQVNTLAILLPEPRNPHDRHAIQVTIDGRVVGYVPKSSTAAFHEALAAEGLAGRAVPALARIVGGWRRPGGDEGHFGVKLSIADPPEIVETESPGSPPLMKTMQNE